MSPEEILRWLEADPFVPFAVIFKGGDELHVLDAREAVPTRTHLHHFTRLGPRGLYGHPRMVGWGQVERVEVLFDRCELDEAAARIEEGQGVLVEDMLDELDGPA